MLAVPSTPFSCRFQVSNQCRERPLPRGAMLSDQGFPLPEREGTLNPNRRPVAGAGYISKVIEQRTVQDFRSIPSISGFIVHQQAPWGGGHSIGVFVQTEPALITFRRRPTSSLRDRAVK